MLTAARRFCAAALTSPRAAATPEALTCLSLSSEARKAAAHKNEFDGEAVGEAVVADEVAVEGVPEVPESVRVTW